MSNIDIFFADMRERHSIYLKRKAGLPRPWTADPVMDKYRITNPFRENDKTTVWFRENVRNPLRDKPEVFLATVMFRWFTRISVGQVIFNEPNLWGKTLFDEFLETGDAKALEFGIRKQIPEGPWATGAYTLTSPAGLDKLAGIVSNINTFYHGKFPYSYDDGGVNWRSIAEYWTRNPGRETMEDLWRWLKNVPYQGPFHSYENVTDLRHTAMLDHAPDINTFAHAGPGAQRGLNWVHGREFFKPMGNEKALAEMIELLNLSRDTNYWPNNSDYPPLELREIEMWLCEEFKIAKTRLGIGRPRGVYGSSIRLAL